eukprot:gene16694-22834_t
MCESKTSDVDTEILKSKIKSQVEFYFSDSNFRKDTFLKAAVASDPEGFVKLDVLLTFNKLKTLTTDKSLIEESLKDSSIVVCEGEKVKKLSPLSEIDTSAARTIYVKGYPIDDATITIESIGEQFSVYGKVCLVRMRRFPSTKDFKGSVFIEFETEDHYKAALAASKGPDGQVILGYKETPFLCVMPFIEWLERKKLKSGKSGIKSNEINTKRKLDDDDEEADDDTEHITKKVATEETKSSSIQFTPGLILKVEGIPTTSTFIGLKEYFNTIGEVRYVEYADGDSKAFIRSQTVESTNKILKVLTEGPVIVPNSTEAIQLTGILVEGEDETAYWAKIGAGSNVKKGNSGRGGGRGGRGGRGWGGRKGNKKFTKH